MIKPFTIFQLKHQRRPLSFLLPLRIFAHKHVFIQIPTFLPWFLARREWWPFWLTYALSDVIRKLPSRAKSVSKMAKQGWSSFFMMRRMHHTGSLWWKKHLTIEFRLNKQRRSLLLHVITSIFANLASLFCLDIIFFRCISLLTRQ